jgi:hypothetical protein
MSSEEHSSCHCAVLLQLIHHWTLWTFRILRCKWMNGWKVVEWTDWFREFEWTCHRSFNFLLVIILFLSLCSSFLTFSHIFWLFFSKPSLFYLRICKILFLKIEKWAITYFLGMKNPFNPYLWFDRRKIIIQKFLDSITFLFFWRRSH